MKVKSGLAKAILEEDFAAATVWVVNLHKFVILYGLNFSKEDHVYLIKVELTKKLLDKGQLGLKVLAMTQWTSLSL